MCVCKRKSFREKSFDEATINYYHLRSSKTIKISSRFRQVQKVTKETDTYDSLYYIFRRVDFGRSSGYPFFWFSLHLMDHLVDARVHQVVEVR